MAQAEGEKELVLGNKQLISLFFVVVALCGVFFAMGYMIGHNTSKAVAANSDTPVPVAAPSSERQSPLPQGQTADSEPPRDTAPAVAVTPPPAAAPEQPTAPAPAPEPRTQAARDTPAVPQAGATYLQVTALRRPDADNLVKTLREQSFPALLAESSKPELFRVMVGPYHQTADVADAKARLKSLGFANAFVQK